MVLDKRLRGAVKMFKSFMDCGDEYCSCQVCKENECNGGTCTHCFVCIDGCKADGSVTECFKPLNENEA